MTARSTRRRLVVREPNASIAVSPGDVESITTAQFRRAVRHGDYFRLLKHYSAVELDVYSLAVFGRLWPYALLLPPLSRGETVIRDSEGGFLDVKPLVTFRLVGEALRDRAAARSLRRRIEKSLDEATSFSEPRTYDASKLVLYLRTDFWFGIASGGSVGHVAGIVNGLGQFGGDPVVFTTDPIPTVADSVETHVVRPGSRFRNLGELRMAAFNESLVPQVETSLGARSPGLVYQRSSAFNFSGLLLADRYRVPLALEYNSSQVWTARNWYRRLDQEALAGRIELANLHGADLVIVVSVALRDELVARGVDCEKILVNPNGVNTDVYSPDVDGGPVRERLGLHGKTTIGFIGTFGRWHGAEVLAEAYGRLIERTPEFRETVRLLMIGDGFTMPQVVNVLDRHGVLDIVILTGSIPQAEGPAYLAACDILVSPHIPNDDGSPFFGSPTKLFEYMAMGKGIIASRLDQIGDLLEDGRTAVMVPPGDADALAAAMERLVLDPDLRARLGYAAREQAVARHTWREHTRRIIDAIRARCG